MTREQSIFSKSLGVTLRYGPLLNVQGHLTDLPLVDAEHTISI